MGRLSTTECTYLPTSLVTIDEAKLLRLQLDNPTARKQAPAEPMILPGLVKAAAFDGPESAPSSLFAARVVVSVERHRWVDQHGCPHQSQAISHTDDHQERLHQVEGGLTELREAVTDALRSELNRDQQVFDLLRTHDHHFAGIAVDLQAIGGDKAAHPLVVAAMLTYSERFCMCETHFAYYDYATL